MHIYSSYYLLTRTYRSAAKTNPSALSLKVIRISQATIFYGLRNSTQNTPLFQQIEMERAIFNTLRISYPERRYYTANDHDDCQTELPAFPAN